MKNNIVEYFASLTTEKKEDLINHLVSIFSETDTNSADTISKIRNDRIEEKGLHCPNCESREVISFGYYSNKKCFRCKECKKTFSEFTHSPLYWLHKKELFREYFYYFLQGYPLRRISDEMDICLKTAFDWRHKILFALNKSHKGDLDGLGEVNINLEADMWLFEYYTYF